MTAGRELDSETISRMLDAVRPDWELRGSRAEDRRHTTIFHLEVVTDDGGLAKVPAGSEDAVAAGLRSGAERIVG